MALGVLAIGKGLATVTKALAPSALWEGVKTMQFDGMGIFAIIIVLILGYIIGRVWSTPATMVGLP
jgi:hypothetical protein